MNKTAIKNFAIWARNKLIADISYRAGLMGITADGIRKALPQSTGTTEFYDIGTAEPYSISGDAVKQRNHLVELIQRKERETNYRIAYKYVIEEVAYTWFNRLIAVRFMEVNDYLPSHIRVLSSNSGKMEPDLVTTPFDAELSFSRDEEQLVYQLKQENKIDELFRILFIKQCNTLNDILPALFEKTSDYTELLLNISVIDQDGVVYHLVHDIPEGDFDVERGGQVEIIGWLYQFYNSEPKDETFALLKKNIKITKDTIPFATQLFTPDWIVRYMVENSLGRLWVEGHPNDELMAGWRYYLEESEQEPEVQAELAEIRAGYAKLNPEDIKVIDPCMGSGHILVYAFDVLMQIYESAGYGQRDAARSILENNLYGLDIDDRAFQMAYFAVMMKARQYNRRILNGKYKPNVYSIQESNEINRDQLEYFGGGLNEFEKNSAITQMNGLLDTFKNAKEYGSILTVDQYEWDLLDRFVSNIEMIGQMSMYTVGLDDTAEQLKQMIAQGKVLAQKYHVTITNPPYMGSNGMANTLAQFIKKYYPDSKSDLSTVFMERVQNMCSKDGFWAMINIPVWMFISSYEKLRSKLLGSSQIVNMLHLGRGIFGADFGTTSFVVTNRRIPHYNSPYFRLFDRQGEVNSIEGIQESFLLRKNRYLSTQDDFEILPGSPIAYWAGKELFDAYKSNLIGDKYSATVGVQTGDNNRFLKCWFEVSIQKIDFHRGIRGSENYKWFPHPKGGAFRKWYGNYEYVIDWENNGSGIKNYNKSNVSIDKYYKNGLCWSHTTSGAFSARLFSKYSIPNLENPVLFCDGEEQKYLLGLMNSNLVNYLLNLLNSTLHYHVGDILRIPLKDVSNSDELIHEVEECISIAKKDWDSFELSWDFKVHPLISKGSSVGAAYDVWEKDCNCRVQRLRVLEESINRFFSNLYGLNYISSEVEDKYITVRKANLRREMVSLISYIVGCIFGRFSLDAEGIAYAGGNWNSDLYVTFLPDQDNVIPITDEEYLEDDIVSRLCLWLKKVYGEQTLEENLDFIAKALGNKGDSSREIIRNYFLNDFFKDHCQTYSVTGSGKRPIYWLFDSGKQNGFKALIYLHRYNVDTIGNLRIDYLHRMQRIYESEISRMQDMIDHSTSSREVAQATKRREKLIKQLKECREYDEKLAHLALSRIELDLDDGVKKNYRKIQTANDGKIYEVLADSKNIMAKE